MTNVEITISRESAIMAFRMAPSRRWVAPAIGGGILAVVLVMVAIFGWLMYRQPMRAPAKTAVLVSLSPTQARAISPDIASQLPPLWQTALKGTSRWHVLLGAYLDASGWHSFAIIPRWRQKEFTQNIEETRFLTTLVTDAEPLPLEKTDLRYGDLGSGKARVNLNALPIFADANDPTLDLPSAIDITWKQNVFQTSLALDAPPFDPPLKETDLSLIIGNESPAFLNELMIGKWPLNHFLPGPLELNVQLPELGNTMRLEAIYQKPITIEQSKRLLTNMVKSPLVPMTLPDGTVVFEERAPDVNATVPISLHQASYFGSIDIQDRTFRLGLDDQTFQEAKPACPGLKPYARLSSPFIANILSKLGITRLDFIPNGIQIGSLKQHLALCS